MRALIQRVTSASVHIEGNEFSKIDNGLLVLLGIEDEDSESDIDWLSSKISQMRIFDDGNGLMNLSVIDINGKILVVSQFTLHASTKKETDHHSSGHQNQITPYQCMKNSSGTLVTKYRTMSLQENLVQVWKLNLSMTAQ